MKRAPTGHELEADHIEELRREMLRFARLQLQDEHAAEDAVQDAIAAALAATDRFAGRSALKTWVFSILRHKIIDTFRSARRSISVSQISPAELDMDEAIDALFTERERWQAEERPIAWGDPERTMEQAQFWRVFEACLEHLPPSTARVFMMREFLDLQTGEICEQLSITSNNCHVILHRARCALRRCLETDWFEGAEPC